jgi:hypothetical protein
MFVLRLVYCLANEIRQMPRLKYFKMDQFIVFLFMLFLVEIFFKIWI